ncbi:F-box/FBD/LRR-repeat protein [Cardamine amara subsp. amara]|uniref:F-box/FBD/LRR-repeat protein n=1 Tax=Cardamine amara subsp. amara TaxID=228776 RepID=A0ABD1B1P7_CARAN
MACDTLCDLSDSLLTQILLNLPTKDSVNTSFLSKRWRNLWLCVLGLHLRTRDFYPYKEVFQRFMDQFMEFNHRSRLQKFDIVYYDFESYRDRFLELISTVVDHGIQHLEFFMYPCNIDDFLRQKFYKSNTLVSLKLRNVELKNLEFAVSLPCLKILHLYKVCYDIDGPLVVEKLILGCPVLEDLELVIPFNIGCGKFRLLLRVRSQTLKICSFRFGFSRGNTYFTVEIDAPRLKYMSLSGNQSDNIVIKNLSSLLMINIHTNTDLMYPLTPEGLRKRSIFCDFLTGISSVRRMIICEETLEINIYII